MFDRRFVNSTNSQTTISTDKRARNERRDRSERRAAERRGNARAIIGPDRRSAVFARRWCGVHAH